MALVPTISMAGQLDMPLSVIFTTSSASILVDESTEARYLNNTLDAEVLIAEWRPGHCKYSAQPFATHA